MGKTSKSARAERRKKEKRSRKEQNAAKYAAMRDAGQNKKSKRFILNSQRQDVLKTKDHPDGQCGNVACLKCFIHIPGQGIYRPGQVPTRKAA